MKKRLIVVVCSFVLVCISLAVFIKCNNGFKSVIIDDKQFNTSNIVGETYEYVLNNKSIFDDESLNDFVNYNIDISNVTGRSFITKVIDCFRYKSYDLNYTYTFNKDKIRNYLEDYNKTALKSSDAYITRGTDSYKIVKEIYGNEVNIDNLINNLSCNYEKIDLSKYYIVPKVKESNLTSKLNEINSYVNWHCRYSNGMEINSSLEYVDFTDENIVVNSDWISEAISDIVKSYCTVGNDREFRTNSGNMVTVSGGTWGSIVDKEEEINFLVKSFEFGNSIDNRVPIYSYEMNEIGDNYIEISLEDQHVWVYENGKIIMDSPCVTGNTRLKRGTPTGTYYISECINGKYLTGDNYKTWVNKWMRLTNTGIGLHDATWRSSFGGNIYKSNGSHGCINLPKKFAYELFDIAYYRMPVVIY